MTCALARIFPFLDVSARQTLGVDGYQHLGQPSLSEVNFWAPSADLGAAFGCTANEIWVAILDLHPTCKSSASEETSEAYGVLAAHAS
jgi:hypothetical protein